MAGGYTVKRTLIGLRFADPELEGCSVQVRAMSVQDLMDLAERIPDINLDGFWTPGMSREIEHLMSEFIRFTEKWNLVDERSQKRVPKSVKGLRSQELPFVIKLIVAWLSNSTGVVPDLGQGSSSGEPLLEESELPMEALSENQAS